MSRHEQIEQRGFHTAEQEGVGKPHQELISQRDADQKWQGKERAAQNPLAEQDAFYPVFWERFIEKASLAPSGEDPAFWPLRMFANFEYLIADRDTIPNPARHEMGEKLAPIQDSIRRIRTAYEIIAHPHCRNKDFQECIEGQLETDRQLHGRDQVALNDAEIEIVGKLCKTPRQAIQRDIVTPQPEIPFNPQKRVYAYTEVPISPDIDPLGRRHMTTEEIRRALVPKPQLPRNK